MKLIAAERGRFALLFPLEEIRPRRGLVLAELVTGILERYGFLNFPDITKPDQARSVTFRNGHVSHEDGNVEIMEFSIFNDGVVAEARTTELAEFVIDDFLAWGESRFGFRRAISEPRSFYLSHIIVEFSTNFDSAMRQFDGVRKILEQNLAELYGSHSQVQFAKIGFSKDLTQTPDRLLYTDFSIERRVDTAYELNRFYCVAPLPTGKHVEVLEALEASIQLISSADPTSS
jgi:hypothetical protein